MSLPKQSDTSFDSQTMILAPIDFDTNPVTLGSTAIVSEPAGANHGDIVFMSGNTASNRGVEV